MRDAPVLSPVLRGLPPILPGGPIRALVLGSFPSVASLELGEYYGNPHNWFWRVLVACGVITDAATPYRERVAAVRGAWPRRLGPLCRRAPARVGGRRHPRCAAEPDRHAARTARTLSGPAQRPPRAGVAPPLRGAWGRSGCAAVHQPASAALEHARVTRRGDGRVVRGIVRRRGCHAARSGAMKGPMGTPNIIVVLCDDLGYGDLGLLRQRRDRHAAPGTRWPPAGCGARTSTRPRRGACPAARG